MIEPLSIGFEYANTAQAFPNPMVLFAQGRRLGALTGFAHFYGSQPNSTLLMTLCMTRLISSRSFSSVFSRQPNGMNS